MNTTDIHNVLGMKAEVESFSDLSVLTFTIIHQVFDRQAGEYVETESDIIFYIKASETSMLDYAKKIAAIPVSD